MSAERLIEGTTSGEDGQERRARELAELLQELRVVLPGVQVLFAFLLTVPFAPGFGGVSPLQKDVFFGTLVCTALRPACSWRRRRTTGFCSAGMPGSTGSRSPTGSSSRGSRCSCRPLPAPFS